MGRKKRPAASNNVAAHQQPYGGGGPSFGVAPPPPPPMAFDQYGRPIAPPPPMMPQQHYQQQQQQQPPPPPMMQDGPASKRSRDDNNNNNNNDLPELEEGERHSYPVKKYRPDSYYRSIEAFQRYTKAHRMLDASYVRWTQGGGSTPEKPIVFGIRIAGSFLSWGRGKTRDAAIDASIRAAFALVAAHGYDDFTLTEDCFTEEPTVVEMMAPIPPPPPPPPPPGVMGGGGPPPLPPGMPPPLPPGMPPPNFAALPPGSAPPLPNSFPVPPPMAEEMIPQPLAPSANLAVASTVVNSDSGTNSSPAKLIGTTITTSAAAAAKSSSNNNNNETKKKKSSSGLVFSGDVMDEAGDELCMEELRMQVPRYWTLVVKSLAKRNQ